MLADGRDAGEHEVASLRFDVGAAQQVEAFGVGALQVMPQFAGVVGLLGSTKTLRREFNLLHALEGETFRRLVAQVPVFPLQLLRKLACEINTVCAHGCS